MINRTIGRRAIIRVAASLFAATAVLAQTAWAAEKSVTVGINLLLGEYNPAHSATNARKTLPPDDLRQYHYAGVVPLA